MIKVYFSSSHRRPESRAETLYVLWFVMMTDVTARRSLNSTPTADFSKEIVTFCDCEEKKLLSLE